MKIRPYYLCAIFLASLFTSCTVYRDLPIEVLKPGEFDLPVDSRISLLYRNFNYYNDTLGNYLKKDHVPVFDTEHANENIDSLISMKSLDNLSQFLQDHQVAREINIHEYNYLPAISGEHLASLNGEIIRNIARNSEADFIISLESLSYLYSTYSPRIASQGCDVVIAGIWAIYNGQSGTIITHVPQVDTLYWNRFDEMGNRQQTPPRMVALEMAAEEFTDTFGQKFTTDWITTQRIVIVPPVEEFRQATEAAFSHDWDVAEGYWLRYSHERFGRLAFSARFNLALKCELSDDLNAARKRMDEAEEIAHRYRNRTDLELLKYYENILQERQDDMDKLILLEK